MKKILVIGSLLLCASANAVDMDSIRNFRFLYRGNRVSAAAESTSVAWEAQHNFVFILDDPANGNNYNYIKSIHNFDRWVFAYVNYNNQKVPFVNASESLGSKFVESMIWFDTSNNKEENQWIHCAESTLTQGSAASTDTAAEMSFGGYWGSTTSGSTSTRPHLTPAYKYNATGGTYTSVSDGLWTSGTADLYWDEVDDALYLGHYHRFFQVWMDVAIPSSLTFSLAWEYWDGTAWSALTINGDGNLGSDQFIDFIPPADWNMRSIVNPREMNRWWIRIRCTVPALSSNRPTVDRAWRDADPNFDGVINSYRRLNSSTQRWSPGWDATLDLNGDDFISKTELATGNATGIARLKAHSRVPSFWFSKGSGDQTERWLQNVGDPAYMDYVRYNVNRIATYPYFTQSPFVYDGQWIDNWIIADGAGVGFSWNINGSDTLSLTPISNTYFSGLGDEHVEYPSGSPGAYFAYNADVQIMDTLITNHALSNGIRTSANLAQFWNETDGLVDLPPLGRFHTFDDSSGIWFGDNPNASATREFGIQLHIGMYVDDTLSPEDNTTYNIATKLYGNLRHAWRYIVKKRKFFMHTTMTTRTWSSINYDSKALFALFMLVKGDSTWWNVSSRGGVNGFNRFNSSVASVISPTKFVTTAITPTGASYDSMFIMGSVAGVSIKDHFTGGAAGDTITTHTAHGLSAGNSILIALNYGYSGYDYAWQRPLYRKYFGSPVDSVQWDAILDSMNTPGSYTRISGSDFLLQVEREYDSCWIYYFAEGKQNASDTITPTITVTLPRYGYNVGLDGVVASDSTNSVTAQPRAAFIMWKTAGQIGGPDPTPPTTETEISGIQTNGVEIK